jgi:N-methylhydantoinase A/oxoprolinase/acetone carboxylase beta subunit
VIKINFFKPLNKSLDSLKINEYQKSKGLKEKSMEEIALGFIRVANETMTRPIRNLTEVRIIKSLNLN